MRTRLLLLPLFACLMACLPAGAQGWKNTGGPAAQTVAALLPHGSYIFAGLPHSTNANDGGVYRSADEGRSWTWMSGPGSGFLNTGWPYAPDVRALAYTGGQLIAATNNGVFFSADEGVSWTPRVLGLNGSALDIYALAALPNGTLVIGTNSAGIYTSTDMGQTWFSSNNGLANNTTIYSLSVYGRRTFAGTRDALYISTDGAQNWTAKPDSAGNPIGSLGAFSGGVSGKMLACASYGGNFNGGAYISLDSGQTWVQRNGNYQNGGLPFPLGVYTCRVETAGTYTLGTAKGLYHSADRGRTWQLDSLNGLVSTAVTAILPLTVGTMVGTYYAGGTGPAGQPQGGGIYVRKQPTAPWHARNVGLASPTAVGFLRQAGGRLYAGTAAAVGAVTGLYGSTNGQDWLPYTTGLPGSPSTTCLVQKGTDLFWGSYGSGVYRSSDNGAHWVAKNGSGSIYTTYSLLVRHDTIFQGTLGNFYRSTNNGDSWNTASIGLPSNPYVYALGQVGTTLLAGVDGGIYRSSNGNIWTVSGLNSGRINCFVTVNATTVLAGSEQGGLFRSSDKGATWTAVSCSDGIVNPATHSLANAADGTLFAATSNGLLFSKDNGLTMHPANLGLFRCTSETTNLAVDAVEVLGDTVYASNGGGGGIWQRPVAEFVVTGLRPALGIAPLHFFPNPLRSGEMLTVEVSEDVRPETSVELVDALGRSLRTVKVVPGSTRITTEGLAPGLYRLQVGGRVGGAVAIE
ncbi:sialidase family protein [Nostoc sp. NIES-2111]